MANGDYKLEVNVKNVGSAAGREVVMVFAKLPGTTSGTAAASLVAWVKSSELQSGESEKQIIIIKQKYLTTYSSKSNAWILEQGDNGTLCRLQACVILQLQVWFRLKLSK